MLILVVAVRHQECFGDLRQILPQAPVTGQVPRPVKYGRSCSRSPASYFELYTNSMGQAPDVPTLQMLTREMVGGERERKRKKERESIALATLQTPSRLVFLTTLHEVRHQ